MIGCGTREKIELDPADSTAEQSQQLCAVHGCNGTEFSLVFLAEQRNYTTVERRNGNGAMETGHKLSVTSAATGCSLAKVLATRGFRDTR